jgi:cellulose synthase/poly-beta-1,6-N-acetylglucosamine synthase-like glycosyltransferase
MTPSPALPTAYAVLDLDNLEQDLAFMSDGRACRTLVGLVRRDGRLVTTLTIKLDSGGRVSAIDVRSALSAVPAKTTDGPHLVVTPLHRPNLSVIVATCANDVRTARCVHAVLACDYENLEVVVAENRPAESTVRVTVAREFAAEARVRVIDVPRPGLSNARNAGIEAARGEIVAVVVDDRWADTVAQAFDDPSVGCVTGLIVPLSLGNSEQALFDEFAGFGKGLETRVFELGAGRLEGPLFPYAAGTFGSGANTAIRTSIARELGGFESTLGAGTLARGGEDLDMYVRLLLCGQRLVYEPSAIVFHEHPCDREGVRQRAFGYGVGLTAMLSRQLVTGPRLPLLSAIPAGIRHALSPVSGKNAGRSVTYPRALTVLERLGMAYGPIAYARSALAARRAAARALPSGALEPFVPGATGMIVLDAPLGDLDLGGAPSGERYGSLLALVCLHGDTLATIDLPLSDGSIAGVELADRVWREAGSQIQAHARAHGCLRADEVTRDALAHGLTSAACPQRVVDGGGAPFVTVIVPTAGRPERIPTCLAGLTSMDYPRYEVLIVDNAPADGRTREIVEKWTAKDARVRYAAEPLPGSSVARNRGIRESTSALVAFTDDDVEVDPAWLSWMVEPFLADEQVGVVTGLVMPARMDTPEQRWFEQFSGFGKGLEPRIFDIGPNAADGRLLFPYWGAAFGSGNSMAFRRAVLLEIGGFDPALGAGSPAKSGADIESFSHAIIRGRRLAYEPRAVCWHDHRANEAALRHQTFNYGVGCTAILTKWLLRDRRLRRLVAREALGLPLRRFAPRGRVAPAPELARLNLQFAMNRGRGTLPRQLAGFALGPFLYARSLLWARRLRLRDVLTGGQR